VGRSFNFYGVRGKKSLLIEKKQDGNQKGRKSGCGSTRSLPGLRESSGNDKEGARSSRGRKRPAKVTPGVPLAPGGGGIIGIEQEIN